MKRNRSSKSQTYSVAVVVTARGNERRAIYRNDHDRPHFLELLGSMAERYGVQVHAYVLMDNHFHLLLQTPEANLSRAMQWLNVSRGVWFNRRPSRVGHLFQGGFKALIIEQDADWQEIFGCLWSFPLVFCERLTF